MQLYTGTALAKALGLTAAEVENLRKAGVIRYRRGKTYALEESAAAIIEHCKKNWGETADKLKVDYQTERALLMRAKRQDQEFDTRLKEGMLHEAKDVEMILGSMLLNFRARIMAVPAKLAPAIAKEDSSTAVFKMLKEAMDDALNELSDYDALFGTGGNTDGP